jgi:hypothetical protein
MENQVQQGFGSLTKDEIVEILNIAMDSGDWHTPSAYDVNLHELSNNKAAYGWCNISKHNTFNDKEVWFNINANTVKIWEEEYVKGKANKSLFRPIYNLEKLSNRLNQITSNQK